MGAGGSQISCVYQPKISVKNQRNECVDGNLDNPEIKNDTLETLKIERITKI